MAVDPRAQQPWPPKEPGRHRWVAMVVYALTPQKARALSQGAVVDLGDRVDSVIGCFDCGQPYPTAVGTRCRAEGKETRPIDHGALLT